MQVTQGLLLETTKAKTNLESAYESYQTTKENMILAKKVYDKTMVKYKEGISSSMDVIQAHNQYLTAQGDYIRALMELLNAKNALDKLLNDH
jgi:outer membrane protein TolC